MNLVPGLALVFDVDGVIVDSMPVHTEAWRVYLSRLDIDSSGIAERMHGRRNDDIVAAFIGAGLSLQENHAHGAAKEALYREMMRGQLATRLVPGIAGFLEKHAGAPMAVASNAEPANVDFILDGAHFRHYFRVIVDGLQVERPKPYPDIYLCAADKLGVAPANCVVFEDSPAGVQAARDAGTRVVGVETHRALEGVDLHIPDFRAQVLDSWLREQNPE
jgi:beta-phosphoglucomutase